MSSLTLLEAKINPKQRTTVNYCPDFFRGRCCGLHVGGGALLVGGGSVCDDLGRVSTGDEVMPTSTPNWPSVPPPLVIVINTKTKRCKKNSVN